MRGARNEQNRTTDRKKEETHENHDISIEGPTLSYYEYSTSRIFLPVLLRLRLPGSCTMTYHSADVFLLFFMVAGM